MRVGAHDRVGVGLAATGHDHAGQVLDIDLVDDARARRDDLELLERTLSPAQELIALTVAVVLESHVQALGVGASEVVGDHGVVNNELCRGEWLDLGGIATQVGHGFAHGGQVDDDRNAGEILHDHAGRGELDLVGRLSRRIPVTQ